MKYSNWLLALGLLLPACGDDKNSEEGSETADTGAATDPTGDTPTTGDDPTAGGGDAQTPPQGATAVEAWLAEGHYTKWKAQPGVVDPISISPHGKQRIFINDLLAGHGAGEYPVGTAAVKELYDEAGANIIGHAVYLHTKAGTTGDTWYWFEKVPLDSPVPHDDNGIVADGDGSKGPAMTICVDCHSAAGIDAEHPGHDFVYSQF